MNKFKHTLFGSALAAIAMLGFTSCDPCKDVTCLNGGTCEDGNCLCAYGFEGTDCGTLTTSLLSGTYSVQDSGSSSGSNSFTVSVSVSGENLTISEFYGPASSGGFVNNVYATVDASSNTITIARQEPDANSLFVEGSGSISFNSENDAVINFSYDVSDETGSPIVVDALKSTWTQL